MLAVAACTRPPTPARAPAASAARSRHPATCFALRSTDAVLGPGALLPRDVVLFDSLPVPESARKIAVGARMTVGRAEWREGPGGERLAARGEWYAQADSVRSLLLLLDRPSGLQLRLYLALPLASDSVRGELHVSEPQTGPWRWPVWGHRRSCRRAPAAA